MELYLQKTIRIHYVNTVKALSTCSAAIIFFFSLFAISLASEDIK